MKERRLLCATELRKVLTQVPVAADVATSPTYLAQSSMASSGPRLDVSGLLACPPKAGMLSQSVRVRT